MAERKEQTKPLASSRRITNISEEDEAISEEIRILQKPKYIKCCGIVSAVLLILAVTILVLFFTVFRIRNPQIRIDGFAIQRLQTNPTVRLTVAANVSVKNPNFGSFKFGNSTTKLCYGGDAIGEGRIPAGKVRARRTTTISVAVDVDGEKILEGTDLSSGDLDLSSSTEMSGRIKMVMFKRHMVARVNCSIAINVTTRTIQAQNCRRHVSL